MNFSFDATAESVPPVLREELARHLKRFGEKNGGVKHIRFVKLQGNGGTGEEKGASWPSEEAFRIESSPEEVTVSSAGERGLLYGGQTLLQKILRTPGTSVRLFPPGSYFPSAALFFPQSSFLSLPSLFLSAPCAAYLLLYSRGEQPVFSLNIFVKYEKLL